MTKPNLSWRNAKLPPKTALFSIGDIHGHYEMLAPLLAGIEAQIAQLPPGTQSHVVFIGDYLDVSVSPSFIANGDGSWRFNTEKSDPSIYFTAFSDNRDVRPPTDPLGDLNLNGNFWDDYTPPTFAGWTGTSLFDPTQSVQMCSPGRAGMRDQNIYSNKVATGLVMTTIGNTKPLGFVTGSDGIRRLIQRTFVITVTNPDPVVKSVVLHINSQPPGGHASFLQFDQLIDLPVNIAAKSSISREVFVTSTDPKASVPITVTEGSSTTSAGRIVINPDPTNPDIENPDIENPDIENPDIENAEAHAITVSAASSTSARPGRGRLRSAANVVAARVAAMRSSGDADMPRSRNSRAAPTNQRLMPRSPGCMNTCAYQPGLRTPAP